jgi:DNA-binding transcriptional MerR regulator
MENSKLYYSIGEVAKMLDVAPSVLRFWETEFDCIRPVKNRRGTRSYTVRDIELLRRIHYLTRDCGYTLEGAREQLRQRPVEDATMEVINNLQQVRKFLVDLKETL